MKVVKKTDEYTVFQKRSERYAVTDAKGKTVNGEEKAKILLAEGLIKLTAAAPKEEPVVEEVAEEVVEAAAEEAPAEEAPAAE